MTDKYLVNEKNKQSQWLIFIPYITLIISIYHYISNFEWASSGESFKLGYLVWPTCVFVGFIVFLNGFRVRYKFFSFFALYTLYYIVGLILSTSFTFRQKITESIYGALLFAMVVLFSNYTSDYGVSKWFHYCIRIAIPMAFLAYQTMVNTFNVSAAKTYNPVFYFLYFLPFVFFEKKSIIRYCEIALIFITIILSYKRTAFIVFIIIALFVFYRLNREAIRSNKNKISIILLSLMVCVFTYFIFTEVVGKYTNVDWIDRFNALESGSGRAERYERFFLDMGNSNFFQVIFGHGVEPAYYHNDLMQVIYNSGVVGMLLYVGMCIQLLVIYINMSREDYRFTTAYGASLIVFFLDSAVGQVIVVHTWTLQIMVFWGIVLGDFYRKQKLRRER